MTRSFLSGMAQATALTRAGRLVEATALIQRKLRGQAEAPVPPAPVPPAPQIAAQDAAQDAAQTDCIEGEFVVLGNPAAKPAARPSARPAAKDRAPKPRKPLAETLREIARGGMPAGTGRAPRAPAPSARFTLHQYSGPEGWRDYMLFVPDPAPQGPLPVVVMLHGCTQSPQDFADGTGMNAHAQAQGVIVVYPAQTHTANMNKCWNWFRPGDQGRDAGEPALLAAITREVLARQNADPARIYVAGLSAGGAAAAVLAQAYPDLFAAIGVHSGLAAGAAQDVGSAFAAMRGGAAGFSAPHHVPTIVFHGTADATVHLANATAVADQAQRGLAGKRVTTTGRAANGRSYSRTVLGSKDRSLGEVWLIDGAGHAWSGGNAAGSYTDPEGPDASAEMLRFFAQHRRVAKPA
ncbi:MAG: PHB depolymerase family esterase [Pseudomonadota bacterium]